MKPEITWVSISYSQNPISSLCHSDLWSAFNIGSPQWNLEFRVWQFEVSSHATVPLLRFLLCPQNCDMDTSRIIQWRSKKKSFALPTHLLLFFVSSHLNGSGQWQHIFIIIQALNLYTSCFETWFMKILSLDKKKHLGEDFVKQK